MATETFNIEDEFDALLDTLTISLKNPPTRTQPPALIHDLPPRVAVKPVNPNAKKTPPPVAAKPKKFQRSTTEHPAPPPGDVCVDVVDGNTRSSLTSSGQFPRRAIERSQTGDDGAVDHEDLDLPPPPMELLGEEGSDEPGGEVVSWPSNDSLKVQEEKPKTPKPFNNNYSNSNSSKNSSNTSINNTFGKCGTCGEDIPMQGEGCTTVGSEVFHKDCFKCAECDETLTGIVYYNSISGKPNCQQCYDKTLHQCKACGGKIKERILTALGMSYHPECFACVVCEKKLDGIPFSLDSSAGGQVTCVDCHQAVHSPKCEKCGKLIVEANEEGNILLITAMDKSYHVACYKCEDCEVVLSSDQGTPCFPYQGHLLCQNCNNVRRQITNN